MYSQSKLWADLAVMGLWVLLTSKDPMPVRAMAAVSGVAPEASG